jgi:hypothetical protein
MKHVPASGHAVIPTAWTESGLLSPFGPPSIYGDVAVQIAVDTEKAVDSKIVDLHIEERNLGSGKGSDKFSRTWGQT